MQYISKIILFGAMVKLPPTSYNYTCSQHIMLIVAIMIRYNFLEVRLVILNNVRTDFILTSFFFSLTFSCEMGQILITRYDILDATCVILSNVQKRFILI